MRARQWVLLSGVFLGFAANAEASECENVLTVTEMPAKFIVSIDVCASPVGLLLVKGVTWGPSETITITYPKDSCSTDKTKDYITCSFDEEISIDSFNEDSGEFETHVIPDSPKGRTLFRTTRRQSEFLGSGPTPISQTNLDVSLFWDHGWFAGGWAKILDTHLDKVVWK